MHRGCTMPQIIIIAGPNGAGKTTFARRFLAGPMADWPFVNADEIARELSPLDVEAAALAAGRAMIERLGVLVREGRSFAFETTLSGRTYLRRIRKWQAAGYRVELHVLRLNSAALAQNRVLHRVHQGGHDIPPAVIVRRFEAGLANLGHYLLAADRTLVYNSSGEAPRLLYAVRIKQRRAR